MTELKYSLEVCNLFSCFAPSFARVVVPLYSELQTRTSNICTTESEETAAIKALQDKITPVPVLEITPVIANVRGKGINPTCKSALYFSQNKKMEQTDRFDIGIAPVMIRSEYIVEQTTNVLR